jgi:hypothetical protein
MIEKITKMIRMGVILSITGMITIILSMLYMFNLTLNTARSHAD